MMRHRTSLHHFDVLKILLNDESMITLTLPDTQARLGIEIISRRSESVPRPSSSPMYGPLLTMELLASLDLQLEGVISVCNSIGPAEWLEVCCMRAIFFREMFGWGVVGLEVFGINVWVGPMFPRVHPLLKTEAAREVVARYILDTLPHCRGCGCNWERNLHAYAGLP